ncbi:unnamed protein product [Trichogramma brassicae]|uniref:Uncharacterized protein n=1 Tax=Trichogramma brassicae TaxID=86971 RepID=A0A6H5J3I3_9HYME|nr:unnamed protein product [Trichogramma brassicae]
MDRRRCTILIAEIFFKIDKDNDHRRRPVQINVGDSFGNTPLNIAPDGGRKNLVRLLLDNGADPNLANMDGSTPLHQICRTYCNRILAKIWATEDSNREIVELLLRKDANPNLTNKDGSTALHVEKERYKFLDKFYPLLKNWRGQLPDLREIFRGEELDWLFTVYVKAKIAIFIPRAFIIIDFVARTGFKDEPEVDKDGKPLLRRTTAVHWAARESYSSAVHKLFKIYDKFDVNYVDEDGFTHFHAACQYGCYKAVKEFLKRGQDPNCLPREPNASSVEPPLHLALNSGYDDVARLLLRCGADPNSAIANGLTPLHIICNTNGCNNYLAEILFKIIDQKQKSVQINAQSKMGTPLHLALLRGQEKLVELLLRRGADSNLVNAEGLTPMHLICQKFRDDDLVKIFFTVNDEIHQSVKVDVRDKLDRTPLQWAVANFLPNIVDILLNRGADLCSSESETRSRGCCQIMSVPGYCDLGRAFKDVFSTGFAFDLFKFKIGKPIKDVKAEIDGNFNFSSQKTVGGLSTKYNTDGYGNLMAKYSNAGPLVGEYSLNGVVHEAVDVSAGVSYNMPDSFHSVSLVTKFHNSMLHAGCVSDNRLGPKPGPGRLGGGQAAELPRGLSERLRHQHVAGDAQQHCRGHGRGQRGVSSALPADTPGIRPVRTLQSEREPERGVRREDGQERVGDPVDDRRRSRHETRRHHQAQGEDGQGPEPGHESAAQADGERPADAGLQSGLHESDPRNSNEPQ